MSLAGQQIDRYHMLEEVGHGGMAVVYRGRDTTLDREVAVKVLHAHLSDREESRKRLRREALTVARLRHEHIVEIYDYSGSESEDPESTGAHESYIVTEFIHGITLREWLDTRWEPRPSLAAMIIHRLLLPLEHAHGLGIVHRDIKPENVMIRNDGCIKLMDFGIAQILDQQKLTMTGQLLGSPAYMAPELISGKPVDARTDLFAVGILLYQLATGELPFAGRNPHEVLHRISDGEYPEPQRVCSRVDADLSAIIAKALASDPQARYQSAKAFAAELETYLAEIDIDPEDGAIFEYFRAKPPHSEFLANHDHHVCNALLKRAANAGRSGHTAKALSFLARVFELEPDNHHAKTLLAALKRRGRRMRQLLFGGATLAFAGLVGASVMLFQNIPATSQDEQQTLVLGSQNVNQSSEVRLGSSSSNVKTKQGSKSAEQADLDQRTNGESEQDSVGIESKDKDTVTSVVGSAVNDGSDEQPGSPKPRPKLRTRPSSKQNAGASRGKNGDGNPLMGPVAKSTPCIIQVTNVPAAGLLSGGYKLESGGRLVEVSGSGVARLDVDKQYTVRLSSNRYRGQITVSPSLCESGPRTLFAKPSPARLIFRPKNIPIERLTVECIERSCERGKTLASRFGSLPVPEGRTEWTVKLAFRSTGFRKKTMEIALQPGPNAIDIELDPIK